MLEEARILLSAINKAELNGYNNLDALTAATLVKNSLVSYINSFEESLYFGKWNSDSVLRIDWNWSYRAILFNHDFAKALWGDKLVCYCKTKVGHCEESYIPIYKFHLMEMAILENPIFYLKEYI